MRQIEKLPLFVGSAHDLGDPTQVCQQGIDAVVILAPERLPDPWPRDQIVIRVPLSDDGENSPADLRRAVEMTASLIRDGISTIIVCSAGLSRSVAVVALALTNCRDLSPAESLRMVAADSASDVSPGLWNSLLEGRHKSIGNGP